MGHSMSEMESGIHPSFVRVHVRRQGTDFAYWQSQPYHVRLATLEQIRREYHLWKYGAEPRLQRVCRIAKYLFKNN
jgi:hypothetical protein